MKTEFEIRILEINIEDIEKKLESMGAIKKGEYNQKRYVYDLKPVENGKWIRLRTNGKKTTLAFKDVVSDTIDGTKEVEFEVSSINDAKEFMKKIGFEYRSFQENTRIQYELDGVEIDIDTWPMIPTYMEIEGKTEKQVYDMINKLEIDADKITALNCDDIYRKIYNIDINEIKELKF